MPNIDTIPTPARSEAEGRTFSDHLAEARVRQSGAGFAGPLLTVTDEQLAHADAMIGWRLQRARNKRPNPYFTEAFK